MSADVTAKAAPTTQRVTARPVVSARIAWAVAAIVVVVFLVVALVMPKDNAGVDFGRKDQLGTFVLGVLVAAGFWLLTRPRLVADLESVRIRSFVGSYRTIPWDLVVDVQFPRNARFARLVLPAEEMLALYAIQRLDAERAVAAMRGLRELLAASREARGQSPAAGAS